MSREPMGPDDPRLTAHAMGEEKGELTPGEQAEVDAIRATAETLRAGFATVPMPALDPAHRAAILGGLEPAPAHRAPIRLAEYSGLGALAATLLLVIGLTVAGATGSGWPGVVESGLPNLQVKSFSAPNYSTGYSDENMELVLSAPRNPDSTWLAKHQNVDGGMGFGGAGGGGGHQYGGSAGLAGGVAPTAVSANDGKAFYTNGVGGGGGGVPSNASGKPSSGAFFESNSDGDYRGRMEYVVARNEKARREALRARAEARRKYETAKESGIQGSMSLADLEAHGKLPFNIGKGGFEEWASKNDQTATIGYLSTFDDVTNGMDDGLSTESSTPFVENFWVRPYGEAALSTFSIDVDTAGYSIVRRSLVEQNRMPSAGALRIEELVNYFPYAYDGPATADPFAVHVDAAACPWEPTHRLVRIALKGREIEEAVRPAANLVFLLDVSGSMDQPNKLPLVKQSIAMLSDRLSVRDRVAMVVYAGSSGLVLPSTPAGDHAVIQSALDRLGAGGSTNGGAGIELAYKVASENFIAGGINRVVLATDGDFNVGVSDPSALVKMVEEKAKAGVFLTALGYGMDNLKDSTLEQLADKGNGNYGYIDNLGEARKVLVEQGMSTLHCIAKDVKIQVEFNPAKVAGYRLLGYENRMLAAQDFADDTKDAGEIGAGHTVTALYEVVPAGVEVPGAAVDELRYQRPGAFSGNAESLVVKLRWKDPEGTVSTPREFPFVDGGMGFESAAPDFRFASAVAAFGMVLRDSKCAGSANLDLVREIAAGSLGEDAGGYRAEFLTLVDKAKTLKK